MGNVTGTPKTLEEFKTKYKEHLISDHGQQNYGEGICHGMCLDWMRSMLQEGGRKFALAGKSSGSDRELMLKRQQETHDSFKKIVDELGEKTMETGQLALTLHHQTKQAQALRNAVATREQALNLVGTSGFLQGQDLLNLNLARQDQPSVQDLNERVNSLSLRTGSALQAQKKLKATILGAKSNLHHAFKYFALRYNTMVDDKERFLGITATPLGTSSFQTNENLLLGIRTMISQLGDGQCTLLNFRRPGAGHYVGFFRKGSNYHFFDPNVGWYQVQGEEAAWELFHDLWPVAYAKFGFTTTSWTAFR